MFSRVILLLFLTCNAAFARQLNFRHIGTDHGLPSSEVYWVLQDKRGYIWLATNNGVCRYNGKEVMTYTTAQGLPDNTVLTMCEDPAGRIWFGSQNNEISYWYKDTIRQVPAGRLLSSSMNSGNVVILAMAADDSGNIWINTDQQIFICESRNNFSTLRKLEVDRHGPVVVKSVSKDILMANQVLMKGKGDPIRVVYEAEGVSREAVFRNDLTSEPYRVSSVVRANNGSIFFSCSNYVFGITPDGKEMTRKFEKIITRISMDRDGGLWIGLVKGGVYYYKDPDLETEPLHLLDKYSVGSACRDHEGGVWLTTLERGVFYAPSVAVWTCRENPELDDRIVLLKSVAGRVYGSTYGNYIFVTDSLNGVNVSFSLTDYSKRYGRLATLSEWDDTIYAGFIGHTLVLNQYFEPIKSREGIGIYKNFGWNIVRTGEGETWVQHGGGVSRMGDSGLSNKEIYRTHLRLTCALPGKSSEIYVGSKGGLYLFDKGAFRSLKDLHPLFGSSITAMMRDTKGRVWLTTAGEGVLVWEGNKVDRISKKEGLVSDVCTAVEEDKYGHIWVGTPNGLCCIINGNYEKKAVIKSVDGKGGLSSGEITRLSALDNILWVGTMAGLNCIYTDEFLKPAAPSGIYIRSVLVNNTKVSKEAGDFNYDQNNFRFILEGLTFSGTGPRYRYRIEGLDTAWQETLSDEMVFTNMPAGRYTFVAEVAGRDGIWNSPPVKYSFAIAGPLWFRWWFLLGEILLGAFAVYGIIHYRTRIITKKEKEKTRISRQLAEYEMKALRAQMNPHFVFNAINSIQKFILDKDTTHAYDYLVKFSRLIRSVLNNTKEHEITLQQELDTLALYVELERLRFERAFTYRLSLDTKIDSTMVMVPALLIQPYVENAIWHGLMPLKSRHGMLKVEVSSGEGMLHIRIEDNGIGRKAAAEKKENMLYPSMGMELSGKRIHLFGKGSPASITLTDLYGADGKPSGTRVEIVLPVTEAY